MAARSDPPRPEESPRAGPTAAAPAAWPGVQSHGVLLVLAEPRLEIVQVSANVAAWFGVAPSALLGRSLETLGAAGAAAIRDAASAWHLADPLPLRVPLLLDGRDFTASATLHRPGSGALVVELEDIAAGRARRPTPVLASRLTLFVSRCATMPSIGQLAEHAVHEVSVVTGCPHVALYRFDDDGHASVVAELGAPTNGSPLRRRFRRSDFVLADVPASAPLVRALADGDAVPVPLEPRRHPMLGVDLDLHRAQLTAAAPLAATHLKALGARACVVARLLHDGRVWGMLVAYDAAPRAVPVELRAAVELIAEVTATRVAALEHFAEAQAEVLARRLEQKLIEATATDGDWRRALFDNPRTLLQAVGATGAAVLSDGEVMTCGEVPGSADLRALFAQLEAYRSDPVFATASIGLLAPRLSGLAPRAAGVLAVRLAPAPGEWLVWCRPEQEQEVVWGGAASQRETLRGTAIPWTARERAVAKAVATSLADVIVQIRAVRVLIAESQLQHMRATVDAAPDPVVLADESGRILLANDALARLVHAPFRALESLGDLALLFEQPERLLAVFDRLRDGRQPWRGEAQLTHHGGPPTPVALRADVVPKLQGGLFGFIVVLTDLSTRQHAEEARLRLRRAAQSAQEPTVTSAAPPEVQHLVAALWAHAGVAASELGDSADAAEIAPRLRDVEAATRNAARLSALLARYTGEVFPNAVSPAD